MNFVNILIVPLHPLSLYFFKQPRLCVPEFVHEVVDLVLGTVPPGLQVGALYVPLVLAAYSNITA